MRDDRKNHSEQTVNTENNQLNNGGKVNPSTNPDSLKRKISTELPNNSHSQFEDVRKDVRAENNRNA